MPLIKSASKGARQENIKREIAAGKDPKQAVAIGYSVQRKAKSMAETSTGPNMARTAPSKVANKVTREKSSEAGEIHAKAKKMFRAGHISQGQYDKLSDRASKLKGK